MRINQAPACPRLSHRPRWAPLRSARTPVRLGRLPDRCRFSPKKATDKTWDAAAVVSVAAHDVVDEAVFGGQYRVVDVGVDGQDDRGVPVAADGADGVVPGYVALV